MRGTCNGEIDFDINFSQVVQIAVCGLQIGIASFLVS